MHIILPYTYVKKFNNLFLKKMCLFTIVIILGML